MIKKRETCLYCGEKMESGTAKKKFCSPLHKLYWHREFKRGTLEPHQLEGKFTVEDVRDWSEKFAKAPLPKRYEKDVSLEEQYKRFEVRKQEELKQSEYDFSGMKYLDVEKFTKYPLKDKPKTTAELIEWDKKRKDDLLKIKVAWNTRNK